MTRLFALAALVAAPFGGGPAVAWHPAQLAAGRVDSVYAETVTPTLPKGAKAPSVVCVCTKGHRLPPGLTGNKLHTAFGITGVPEKVGIFRFQLRAAWTSGGRAFSSVHDYSIFIGKAKSAPSDAGMRVGVNAKRVGDTLTVTVVNGGKTFVSDFAVFPVELQITRVLSATPGQRCKRKGLGKDAVVSCAGGVRPGKRVEVEIAVAGAKSKLIVLEATGPGVSTSIPAPVFNQP